MVSTAVCTATTEYYYTLCASTAFHPFGLVPYEDVKPHYRIDLKQGRAPFKSECNAQQLLREVIGFDEWAVYRRTNRLLVRGQRDWLIGNIFGEYNKNRPFSGKPDVVRIDGKAKLNRKWHGTSFCVDPITREELPYTDKVLAFATNCLAEEKEFIKIGNRIGEKIFNKVPECAVFNKL